LQEKFLNFILVLGRYSYEVFLLQMFVFGFNIYQISGIHLNYLTFLLLFPLKIMLSIIPVFLLKKR